MLNHVSIMGRMTRDPELKYTNSKTPVITFTLAVERDFKDSDGNRGCDFLNVTAWGQRAEFVAKYFAKGSVMAVSGRLLVRNWEDNDGKIHYSTEIQAESIYFGSAPDHKNEPENKPEPAKNTYRRRSAYA